MLQVEKYFCEKVVMRDAAVRILFGDEKSSSAVCLLQDSSSLDFFKAVQGHPGVPGASLEIWGLISFKRYLHSWTIFWRALLTPKGSMENKKDPMFRFTVQKLQKSWMPFE